ncbi:MAG: hypothetical protein ABUS49_10195 [Acidobacteriota bacterium]
MLFAGVLGIAAATTHADQDVTKNRKKFDLREAILRNFFKENHCPIAPYSGVFVSEADAHGLDWRLLPSLSIVESGGGKHARGFNLFGWANGKTTFDSISDAVHHVAATLSLGRAYRGKDLAGKLLTYNHRPEYSFAVTDMMKKIYPTSQVAAEE